MRLVAMPMAVCPGWHLVMNMIVMTVVVHMRVLML